MRSLLKKLILWALGPDYPRIIIADLPANPQMIDIRVPKKVRK